MQQRVKKGLSFTVLTFIVIGSIAQNQKKAQSVIPRWVSEKGYWVVKTNNHYPLDHVVSFYNNDNVLLYKETVKGVRLNPDKRKVKTKLKRVLESVVMTWEKKKDPDPFNRQEFALVKSVL